MTIEEATKRVGRSEDSATSQPSPSRSVRPSSYAESNGAAKCPFASEQHEGKEMVNASLHLSPQAIFKFLFQDDSFLNRLYAIRKYDDRVSSEWERNADTGEQTRKVTYKVTLPSKALGPSHSFVSEYQTMSNANKDNEIYINNSEVFNEGIPYGDSFVINIHYCILREASVSSTLPQTRFSFWVLVMFKKSPFFVIKNLIERNALDGLETLAKDIVEAMKIESEKLYGTIPTDPRLKSLQMKSDRKSPEKRRKTKKPPLPPPQRSVWKSSSAMFVYFLLLLLGAMNAYLLNRIFGLERTADDHVYELNILEGTNQESTVESLRNSLREMELQELFLNKFFDRWKEKLNEAYRGLRMAEDAIVDIRSLMPEYEREWKEFLLSAKENLTLTFGGEP